MSSIPPRQRLKIFLAKKNMTITQFAEMAGISRNFLYSILEGIYNPHYKLAKKIEELSEGVVKVKDFDSPSIQKALKRIKEEKKNGQRVLDV